MQVTLVSMPWAIFNRPSIQLGTLKAWLERECPGCTVHCAHPLLDSAAAIGLDTYRSISENPWAGEALYSALLFPDNREQARKLFARETGRFADRFDELSELLAQSLDNHLDALHLEGCDLLGLSVCFSQLLPSLYAAERIKQRHPDLPIVFGGSTCTPALARGLLHTFPSIDYVVTGEGERPLTQLVNHLGSNTSIPPTGANIFSREMKIQPDTVLENRELPALDQLPVPDYHDYFRQVATLGLPFASEIPFEFSRGCWWNKCSFCNLNLQWCGYRFKEHKQVLLELATLTHRHQSLDFFFTDNALPPAEARRFFRQTASSEVDHRFFAEIRVPKSSRECRIMRRGGLRTIQTGIEALSDSLLDRMHKGTSLMDNVAAMKFALAAGIRLEGNLILEFPGSTEAEVAETLHTLKAIFCYPPLQAARFFLGQGSPVCAAPRRYHIAAVTVHANNRLLYPAGLLSSLDLLIKGYRGDREHQRILWRPVRRQMVQWRRFHARRPDPLRPVLGLRDGGDFLLLRQETPDGRVLRHRLKGVSRKIYLACTEPVAKKELLQRFKTIKKEQLDNFLAGLAQKRLVFLHGDSCLALAVAERN